MELKSCRSLFGGGHTKLGQKHNNFRTKMPSTIKQGYLPKSNKQTKNKGVIYMYWAENSTIGLEKSFSAERFVFIFSNSRVAQVPFWRWSDKVTTFHLKPSIDKHNNVRTKCTVHIYLDGKTLGVLICFRRYTCVLLCFSWLLDHVIYLKLRRK